MIDAQVVLSRWRGKVLRYDDAAGAAASLFRLIDDLTQSQCLVVLENLSALGEVKYLDTSIVLVTEGRRMAYLVNNAKYYQPHHEFLLWVIDMSLQQLFYVQERVVV